MQDVQWNIRQRNRKYVFDYLSTHPCIDCGESDIRCLDFDHVRGKKFKEVGRMLAGHYSLNKIQTEIDKCEVRCSNCHRKKTSNDTYYHKEVYLGLSEP